MKIIIINEITRNRFELSGKLEYMYTNKNVTRLHIKSTFDDIFSFEQEAKRNEEGLKSIGMDTDKNEIAHRKLGDLLEYFMVPAGFGVQLTE